jgi:hypothetical protein
LNSSAEYVERKAQDYGHGERKANGFPGYVFDGHARRFVEKFRDGVHKMIGIVNILPISRSNQAISILFNNLRDFGSGRNPSGS